MCTATIKEWCQTKVFVIVNLHAYDGQLEWIQDIQFVLVTV